jgi:hypothetical protein
MLVTINYDIYLIQNKIHCFEFHSNCFIMAQHVSFIYSFLLFLLKHAQEEFTRTPDKFE